MNIRVCDEECWNGTELSDCEPHAVRWATRDVRHSPDWTKFHYTEGNHLHTACGLPVIAFLADGSPDLRPVERVNCKRCLAVMRAAGRKTP